jgi:hypothetical protein
MMGLEPTTFCMASRRSSQLSYIREAASIASLFPPAAPPAPPRAADRAPADEPYVAVLSRRPTHAQRHAGKPRRPQLSASRASFTSRSASSLWARRTAV